MIPRKHIANALSLLRVLVAPPTAYSIVNEQWLLASLLIVLAILSDFADGYLARRFDNASPGGGLLDHSCDAIFVSSSLFALAYSGTIPVLLPILVVLSFAQYVLDSNVLAGHALRSNRLGRNNGIAYYALVCVGVIPHLVAPTLLPPLLLIALTWLVIASTLLSMADRLWAVLTTGSST